jgi:hypothetical protein
VELAVGAGCFLSVDSHFDAESICRVAEGSGRVVQVGVQEGGKNIGKTKDDKKNEIRE